MAEEWDVFALQPGGDYAQPEYLATLYEASQKTIRVELNGTGEGSFAINRGSPECTEAILAQGNLVKVRIPEISTEYVFAFFLETGDFTLVSSEEAGGEMLHFGGRGILSYLEYACAWSESYVTGGDDPEAGVWRAYNAGTGSAPGQILRRMIEEMQHADRPQQPLPLLTIDFDYTDDSTAVAWDTTDATDEFSYQVGETGLAITQRLIDTETITVQMSPDFLLSAYNPANYGRDLTGDAFGPEVVRFVRGVNIATELRREQAALEARTHMLVSGEADQYGTAALTDAADRVTREAFMTAFGTGATALNAIGAAELQHRLAVSDTIMFPIANRRTAVDLANPVTVGAVAATPGLATAGYYLPGPEGTNGDFWVGDTVRLHTGTGAFDYDEINGKVMAITITREDDNHELIVIPELKTSAQPSVPSAVLYRAQTDDDYPAYVAADIYPIAWRCSGDRTPAECVAYPDEPTVGPLTPTAGFISDPLDPPSTGPIGNFLGWTFSGVGTIDFTGTFQAFTAANGITCTVDILIDGVVVATGNAVTAGGGCIITVTGTDVAVAVGSVLTGRFYYSNPALAIYLDTPLGDETSSSLRITGGSLFA